MTTNIKLEKKEQKSLSVRVRIIKAPLVDTEQLRQVLKSRSRAVVI